MELAKLRNITCMDFSAVKLLFLVISILSPICISCPKKCVCRHDIVRCKDAGLTNIPPNISSSVLGIDLSDNPLIKLNEASFIKFKSLRYLYLKNCSLRGPIILPPLLERINLAHNAMTLNSMQHTFLNSSPTLSWIDISKNTKEPLRDLTFLPRTVKYLNLEGNSVPKIKRTFFHGLNVLGYLGLSYCGLKLIEMGAFDSLKQLTNLHLERNELHSMPRKTFRSNYKLDQLFLSSNSFSTIPDVRGPRKLKTVDLSYNINLTSLTNETFLGVKGVSQLFLQRNNIQGLPNRIFENMSVSSLSLYGNNIKRINDALNNMRSPPSLILLFANPPFKTFIAKEFRTLSSNASIYVSCKNLREFSGLEKIQPTIKCSPFLYYNIQSKDISIERRGYDCRFNKKLKEFICRPCLPGSYGGGPCKLCPPGSFYQDEVAKTDMKNCPPGQFVPPEKSPGKSALDCLTCPRGTRTNLRAGFRACRCLQGFARTYRFGGCEKCNSPGISCSNEYKQLKKGYWWFWNGNMTSNITCKQSFQAFVANLETENDSYYRNSSRFTCAFPKPHKCPIRASCLGGIGSSCHENYTGVLCAVCEKGYYRQFSRCIKCPSSLRAVLEFIGCIIIFILLCMLITWIEKPNSQDNETETQQQETRTPADIILSNLKIILGFYQVLSGIMRAFSYIPWPHRLRKAVSIFDFVQFQVLRIPSLRCINPDWGMNIIDEFWFTLVTTILIPATIFLYFQAKKIYLSRRDDYHRRCRDSKKQCLRTVVLFLFATYPLASQRIIQILPPNCHRICSDSNCTAKLSLLRTDYSVECLSFSTNLWTIITGYSSLLIPLGFPVFLWILMWRFAPKTDVPQDTGDYVRFDGNDSVGRFALKFVYENYKRQCWYWEVLEMLRKLLMTAGLPVLLQTTKFGLSTTIFVAGVFAASHAHKHPIKESFENRLQLLSLCIIPINLCLGAALQSNNGQGQSSLRGYDGLAIGITLVLLNSSLILIMVMRCIRALVKNERTTSCCRSCKSCLCSCLHFAGIGPVGANLDHHLTVVNNCAT